MMAIISAAVGVPALLYLFADAIITEHRAGLVCAAVAQLLVAAVVIHVGALWITSPQDVIDVFLFQSPTPFSVWGVVALAAVFAAALLAALRRRLRLRPRTWRISHASLAAVTVVGTVVHAILIVGTMETVSKAALCGLVLAATTKVITDLRLWPKRSAAR